MGERLVLLGNSIHYYFQNFRRRKLRRWQDFIEQRDGMHVVLLSRDLLHDI